MLRPTTEHPDCEAPEADSPTFTGVYTVGRQHFLFYILRLWEIDPEAFMSGPLALMALTPLAHVEVEDLPDLIERMQDRARREAEPAFEREFWTGVEVILGWRLEESDARRLLEGIFEMLDLRESTTYQAILREGKAEGEAKGRARGIAEGIAAGKAEAEVRTKQSLLIRFGSRRLGAASESAVAKIEGLTSAEELDRSVDRLFDVETWDDLLA